MYPPAHVDVYTVCVLHIQCVRIRYAVRVLLTSTLTLHTCNKGGGCLPMLLCFSVAIEGISEGT